MSKQKEYWVVPTKHRPQHMQELLNECAERGFAVVASCDDFVIMEREVPEGLRKRAKRGYRKADELGMTPVEALGALLDKAGEPSLSEESL